MATPPDFVAGNVLTAAQMNAIGLWQITTGTFTTVAGFNLPDNSFTADYDNYKLIVIITAVALDADFTGRMRGSGTNATGANYDNTLTGITNTAAAANIGTNSQTAFNFGESDTVLVEYRLDIDILNPAKATITQLHGSMAYVNKAATALVGQSGVWHHRLANAYDSFAFISTQNISGTYYLYGYRD